MTLVMTKPTGHDAPLLLGASRTAPLPCRRSSIGSCKRTTWLRSLGWKERTSPSLSDVIAILQAQESSNHSSSSWQYLLLGVGVYDGVFTIASLACKCALSSVTNPSNSKAMPFPWRSPAKRPKAEFVKQ